LVEGQWQITQLAGEFGSEFGLIAFCSLEQKRYS